MAVLRFDDRGVGASTGDFAGSTEREGLEDVATDRQVPSDQAAALESLFRDAGKQDVTVRVFPGVNHLFVPDPSGDFLRYDRLESGAMHPDVLETVARWLARQLAPGEHGRPGLQDVPPRPRGRACPVPVFW